MDSCGDHYISNAADTPPKYNSGVQVATTTAGRHGYGYSGVRSTLTKYLVGAATARPISSPICIWGCALKWWGGTAVDSPLRIVDTPGPVLHLKGTTGGGFQVLRAVPSEGTVVIAESDPAYYAMNRWFYLEWESLLAEVAGYTKVWVNGELIIDESGLETYTTEYQELHDLLPSTYAEPSTNRWIGFALAGASTFYVDDLYILDGTDDDAGLAPGDPRHFNAPLGDVEITCRFPDGEGFATDFTPTTGDNWQMVDETDPDEDTTVNTSLIAGDSDLHEIQDIDTDDTILGVQLLVLAKRSDDGFAAVTPQIRQDATTYDLQEKTLPSDYTYTRDIFPFAPDGSLWTDAIFTAIQGGYKRSV
jgi:hypothetical protein